MTKVFEVVAWDDRSNSNSFLPNSHFNYFFSLIEITDDCTTETFKV